MGAESPPEWYFDREGVYPPERFLSGAGEGSSLKSAQNGAIAQISFFFRTEAAVWMAASSAQAISRKGKESEYTKNEQIAEKINVQSEEEFLGLRFAAAYFDKKSGVWHALAYIDKNNAFKIYDAKIKANTAAIDALSREAEKTKEPFTACSLFAKTLPLIAEAEKHIYIALALQQNLKSEYGEAIERFQNIQALHRAKRGAAQFRVIVSGDRNGRIKRHIERVLTEGGYAVGEVKSPYTMRVEIEIYEEKTPKYFFVRAGLRASAESGKKQFATYSANYEKEGHIDLEGAYERIFNVIEEDILINLIEKLIA